MSGGVDSSVAAAILKEKGFQVTGLMMRIWDGEGFPEGKRHGCYGPGEAEDEDEARRVAQTLGIDFLSFDLSREYRAEVLDYFRNQYSSGRTPNPCLRCNRYLKFNTLPRMAQDNGLEFDYLATGHYARIELDADSKRYVLKKARDLSKDQSYFLAFLSQEQLARSLFPLGNHTKQEVKAIAQNLGLEVDGKPESQDFISGGYLALMGETRPGPIVDREANILGEHQGIAYYTIGQRKRLGISASEPLYVIGIDPAQNIITVGSKEDVYGDRLIASELNWIAIENLRHPAQVRAKIRYNHEEAEATVIPIDEDRVCVEFKEPQMAITPGQAVVFYNGDIVLGAGIIEKDGVTWPR
jgi:tRNA-specific 2-thiouridylase